MTQPWSPAPAATSGGAAARREPASLADILERVLDKGIVVAGDIRVDLLDIELLTIRIRLLIASVDRAKEMGIDWWEHDPSLSSGARDLAEENRQLRERVGELEAGSANGRKHERHPRAGAGGAATGPAMADGGTAAPGGSQATWLYAIAGDLDAAALQNLTGIGGLPPRALPHEGLLAGGPAPTAVVGSVDAQRFSEDGLEELLSDPATLELLARGHHQVVAGVAAAGPALPLRLATVYRDDDRVRALLAEHAGAFSETLGWLASRTECGVKVWADPGGLGADSSEPEPAGTTARHSGGAGPGGSGGAGSGPGGSGPGSGAAYLSRRRAQLADRDTRVQRAADRGAEVHEALTALAVAGHSHQPQDARVTGEPGLMVLNGAYLVDVARLAEFGQSARELVARVPGLRVDVTGPWPPYSFAEGPRAAEAETQRAQGGQS